MVAESNEWSSIVWHPDHMTKSHITKLHSIVMSKQYPPEESKRWNCIWCCHGIPVNPFTPESDQCQNSLAASQEIWHHTVWRTWRFIAYSDVKWLYYKFSLHHSYNRFLKGWENTLFELRSERVNRFINNWKIIVHHFARPVLQMETKNAIELEVTLASSASYYQDP